MGSKGVNSGDSDLKTADVAGAENLKFGSQKELDKAHKNMDKYPEFQYGYNFRNFYYARIRFRTVEILSLIFWHF